jgi:Holliday junction DNA helicase RuvA
MTDYFAGKIVSIEAKTVVIDVNSVGYEVIFVGDIDFEVGQITKLYIHVAISEFAQIYYGFTNKDIRALYKELIKIKKIGCKRAEKIINSIGYMKLAIAIFNEDRDIRIPYVSENAQDSILGLKLPLSEDKKNLMLAMESIGFKAYNYAYEIISYDAEELEIEKAIEKIQEK